MAYSVTPKIRRDGVITLMDSGATNTLQISYEDGNFTLNGLPTKEAQTIIRDRGTVVSVRKGDSEPTTSGSFSVHFRQFGGDTTNAGSVLDFIYKRGFYAANSSTGDTGVPRVEHYCIDIKYEVEGTAHGDDSDHTVTLSKCVVTGASFTEGDPSSLALEFVCYGGFTLSFPT